MTYDFATIERRWQGYWEQQQTFRTPNPGQSGFDPGKPKFYCLDMFPYPSGVGLHVGHPLGYIATDIVSRYKRMAGFNVLHPMGYDAFGLPAEQFAIEHGVHPRVTTDKNIANMTRQLKRLGLSYDWQRCLTTTDPRYYKWTQWVFLQMYHSWFDPGRNRARPIRELVRQLETEQLYVGPDGELVDAGPNEGLDALTGSPIGVLKWHELSVEDQRRFLDDQRLAYMAQVPVNWCPTLGTVLANEEVTAEGRSERGNYPVYKRPLRQWMLRITAYAPRLEDDLAMVDWPDPIKLMQRNWIGRSQGAAVSFALAEDSGPSGETIQVFTTRPDTLFGATYMVLAPEHPLVGAITTPPQYRAVDDYRRQARSRADADRLADTPSKTGVFTGAYAVNPVNGEKIPIWIADYVMMGYGTGAIMAVPAHDQRDLEFAKAFGLPIRDVVYPPHLGAISVFCRLYDRDRPKTDDPVVLMSDFVGWRINAPQHPEEAAWETITTRRRDTAEVAADPSRSGERRGGIAGVWYDTLREMVQGDLEGLIRSAGSGCLIERLGQAVSEPGVCVHSANDQVSLDGRHTPEAKKVMTDWLASRGIGRATTRYKLRDWLFSRQRYWGEPFPILHAPDGTVVPVDESELPVELPPMQDFKPEGMDPSGSETGQEALPPKPPLGRAPESWRVVERDGVRLSRELNTMPQWAGSCWYYLRFCDPDRADRFVGQEAERYWMSPPNPGGDAGHAGGGGGGGVDLYVGGAEHAVLHLLYARFWHKVLFDLGHLSCPEPFGRLFNQGYIQAHVYTDARGIHVPADRVQEKDGRFYYNGQEAFQALGKMGKSLKNAIAPDEVCEKYGCDTLRLYEMYLGPLDQSKLWRTRDIVGAHRFLQRLWRNFVDEETDQLLVSDEPAPEPLDRKLHQTIKRVTDDIERMSFNTAIAALIELNNELVSHPRVPRRVAEAVVLCLAPFAPHIAEELWFRLGHTHSLAYEPWPGYDESVLVQDRDEYPVQINGKLKARITVPAGSDQRFIERVVLEDDKVRSFLNGKAVRKVIVVKGKMVNVVA